MRLPSRHDSARYLSRQAVAQFIAFFIGIYSTVIVSNFFETRSITNLWGLLAHKTIISDGAFNMLERIVAVIVGFIVFEIVSRNLKALFEGLKPAFDRELAHLAERQDWDAKWATLKVSLKTKGAATLSSVNGAVRNVIKERFSKWRSRSASIPPHDTERFLSSDATVHPGLSRRRRG